MIATPVVGKRSSIRVDLHAKLIPAPKQEPGLRLNSSRSTSMDRTHKNLVGVEIRRRRRQLGWSQVILAHRLQLAGLPTNRSSIAKLECGMLYVGDFELLYFARVLGIRVQHLFPNIPSDEPLSDVVAMLLGTPRTHPKKRAVMNGATRVSRTRETQ